MLNDLLSALFFTLVIEVAVAYLLGFKDKKEILAVICVNLITNPALNYFLWANNSYNFISVDTKLIYLLETLIVFTEWRLLVFALREDEKQLLILAILMNVCSYVFGLVIFG
jgi:hypothetical protein